VQQDIGIGMSEQSLFKRDLDAADDQRPPGFKRVNVVSISDAHDVSLVSG
jgi:hypothetical protein